MNKNRSISKALEVLKGFDHIAAVGLTGSFAGGRHDKMSDLDIAVFTHGEPPLPEARKARYTTCGFSDLEYFDVNFEVSHCDGLKIGDIDCGFIWMNLSRVEVFLRAITKDFDSDEFLPGSLSTMKSLFDPDKVIDKLKKQVPHYPENRAMHRIKNSIVKAHFSIYVLAWLEKASNRKDYFSFLKYKYEVLDNFFTALFALNHQWYSHEKRLIEIIKSFEVVPENIGARIESIIMHKGDCENLSQCQQEIKRLFANLVAVSLEKYPDLNLPKDWE